MPSTGGGLGRRGWVKGLGGGVPPLGRGWHGVTVGRWWRQRRGLADGERGRVVVSPRLSLWESGVE